MRVLCCTTAGAGHFGPMIPVAKACVADGHEVAVAAPASFEAVVSRAGFRHLPFPDVPTDVMGAVFDRLPSVSREEGNRIVLGEVFGRLDAQAALPELTRIILDWRPDLVLRDPCEFASLVAAEAAGIPQVQVAIGMGRFGATFLGLIEEPVAELSSMAGLPANTGTELIRTSPILTSVPARLDGDLAVGLVGASEPAIETGTVWRFRDSSGPAEARLPPTWGDLERPLVYVSYGSVAARMAPFVPLYRATLEALADLPIRILMTTGDGGDPAELEPTPSNTRVERWWPQADVMPAATAMVGHGGFGTTMTALAAGVPQVVVPLFASDQFVNAERVAAVGAGLQVAGSFDAANQIPAALERLLSDPGFADSARSMAADIEALPDMASCPKVLLGLVN